MYIYSTHNPNIYPPRCCCCCYTAYIFSSKFYILEVGQEYLILNWYLNGWLVILPEDLITYIAKRIVCMEDLIAFGGVCKSWNSVATKENFIGRLTHQFPLNIFPNKVDTITPEFSNNMKGRFHKLNPPESNKRQRYYPSMGWLMSIRSFWGLFIASYKTINHRQIELPDTNKIKNIQEWSYSEHYYFTVTKFVLFASPSRTSNYTVGVTCELGKVLWRPGEDEWTIADTDVLDQFFDHLDPHIF